MHGRYWTDSVRLVCFLALALLWLPSPCMGEVAGSDGDYFVLSPASDDTWETVLERAYEGSPITPRQALPLLILANRKRFTKAVSLSSRVGKVGLVRLPSAEVVGEPTFFLELLHGLLIKAFYERLATARFDELARRQQFIRHVLYPAIRPEEEDEEDGGLGLLDGQIAHDYELLRSMRTVNDALFALRNHRRGTIELAMKVHEGIATIEATMASAVTQPDLVLKEALQERLATYRYRFACYLEDELVRRLLQLSARIDAADAEGARTTIQGVLKQLRPIIESNFPAESLVKLYRGLGELHGRDVAPTTRERSLSFSNHFEELATLLTPRTKADNYKFGTKISDRDFRDLEREGGGVVCTDCSGFIGRIYRELARLAGLDLRLFVVRYDGMMSTHTILDPQCAQKLQLSEGENPFADLFQGDVFYYEVKHRGEHQRHVAFFDRLILGNPSVKVSLWEASPGGVKNRVRSVARMKRLITKPYGQPRNGVYRLSDMDRIDDILGKRGLTSR